MIGNPARVGERETIYEVAQLEEPLRVILDVVPEQFGVAVAVNGPGGPEVVNSNQAPLPDPTELVAVAMKQ